MKKSLITLIATLMAVMMLCFVGCGEPGGETGGETGGGSSQGGGESGQIVEVPDSDIKTVAEMKEKAMGTCFNELNKIYQNTFFGNKLVLNDEQVKNLKWNIKDDGNTKITEATARLFYISTGNEAVNYKVKFKGDMEVCKLLAGKIGQEFSFFIDATSGVRCPKDDMIKNNPITLAILDKVGINAETEDAEGFSIKSKKTTADEYAIFAYIETKTKGYKFQIKLAGDETPEQIVEKINNDTYEIVTQKTYEYGTTIVDKNSADIAK